MTQKERAALASVADYFGGGLPDVGPLEWNAMGDPHAT